MLIIIRHMARVPPTKLPQAWTHPVPKRRILNEQRLVILRLPDTPSTRRNCTKMLPPKVDAALTVAHARVIKEHRDAHHKATQDHRLAQERCEALEEENRDLRAADARRERALQDALKLLSVATRGKQEAQREATRHKREMRRAATRRMIARGPALPSAVQERLRVMQKRVEALETALHRKDRRCAFLERCLERSKGGSAAIRAVEESDRANRCRTTFAPR